MNVVVTRERGRNESLVSWMPEGATVREVPLTATRFYDEASVAGELNDSPAGPFHSLVVTSVRAVPYVTLARGALADGADIFSVGSSTTRALRDCGVAVRAEAAGVAVDLAPVVSRGPVLLLGARVTRGELATELRASGIVVVAVACYETGATAPDASGEQALRNADVVIIGAPSAWAVAAPFVNAAAWVVVPGATTSAAVRSAHERVLEGWGPSLRERLSSLGTPPP